MICLNSPLFQIGRGRSDRSAEHLVDEVLLLINNHAGKISYGQPSEVFNMKVNEEFSYLGSNAVQPAEN
jgi:hypothetical protein